MIKKLSEIVPEKKARVFLLSRLNFTITVTKKVNLSRLITNGQGLSCHGSHLDPTGPYIPVIRSHGRWLAIYSSLVPSLTSRKFAFSLTCWIPSEVFWTNVSSAFIRCQIFTNGK